METKDKIKLAISQMIGQPAHIAQNIAANLGLQCRIMSADGENYAGTADVRPDRLNLHLNFGEVTKVTLG